MADGGNAHLALLLALVLLAGCGGPGFAGYAQLYAEPDGAAPGEPWQGEESVQVALEARQVVVELARLTTVDLEGAAAVPLTSVVLAAALTAEPQRYRYDFTATDGYDLLRKRRNDPSLLPGWAELEIGVLYRHPEGDLRVTWAREKQPWGSALSAYLVKLMDGGLITLLAPAGEQPAASRAKS